MLTKIIFFICCLAGLLLSGCFDESYHEKSTHRAKIAEQNKQEPILIGISWEENDQSFLDGVNLAIKKINNSGGILDRPLKAIINIDESKLWDPTLSAGGYQDIVNDIAESFTSNPNIVAVIGHITSKTALLASVIYENNGLLFLTPSATNIKLTNHQFNYVFRTIPSNREMGVNLAKYIAEKGYKKIALLYDREVYATELSNTFSSYISEKHGAKIVYRQSFFRHTLDIESLVIELNKIPAIDIIFVVSTDKVVTKIYQKTRDIGIRTPFAGGEALDVPSFLKMVKEWENEKELKKSIVPTLFNPLLVQSQKFIALFKKEYGEDLQPNQQTALGYDNIILLAHAIKRAESTVSLRIADTLRHMPPCQGITGKYQFSEEGELISKPFYFKELHQGSYDYLQVKNTKKDAVINFEICNEIDRDNDNIPNNLDTCPENTAKEISQGVFLTGLLRGCPIDNDHDTVPDYKDICLKNTLEEISKGIDSQGCPLDSDKDGKADFEDACPKNPELIEFISGQNCVKDSDQDEITDDIDQCPQNTKIEITKGVNKTGNKQGCPIDTDYDKRADYIDHCPNNTRPEISQGVDNKGCPSDNDHDGILDYQDQCLNTPLNILIDSQGCGIVENSIMEHPLALYFKQGQVTLTLEGKAYLEALLGYIEKDTLKKIKITVHNPSQDNNFDNTNHQSLSEEQATTIDTYLQNQGIACEKIIPVGKGPNDLVTDKSPEELKKNHRLEIILIQFRKKILSHEKEN
ncbi:MAG: ABC transporter substrate-binding protein [Methylococcales bacterium]|nr:ABC transporter substrate-binding protein [Methylococcales bacterium]